MRKENTNGIPTVLMCCNSAFGMVNFRMSIIKSLLERGIRVVVVTPYDEFADQLKAAGAEHRTWRLVAQGTNPLKELISLFALLKIYRETSPDIIFNYTIKPVIYGAFAASVLRIPFISVITGLGYVFLNNNLQSVVARKLYYLLLRLSSEIWLLNKDDLTVMSELGIVGNATVKILPGEGVDTEHFDCSQAEVKSDTCFILIARMLKEKGIFEYVEAARSLLLDGVNAKFYLLGPECPNNAAGIGLGDILQWEKDGAVRYLGATNDVRPYIVSSDCVVLPSYREGIPRTLLEASSMRRPIIATNVAGCREVVLDEITGFLCDPRDSTDLKNAMLRFLELNDFARREMGAAGRRLVHERFDNRFVFDFYLSIISKLSSTHSAGT